MSWGFIAVSFSSLGLIAALVSLAIGAYLVAWRDSIARFAPAAQARLALAMIAAPAFVALATLLGFAFQRHLLEPGHHEHQCSIPLTPLLMASGLLLLARLAAAGGRAGLDTWRSALTVRALRSSSVADRRGFLVCAEMVPQAFVAGLWQPRIFLSHGLLAAVDPSALTAIVAHEQAHVRRKDPLRRLFASLLLAFHLPGIAALLETILARTHELAADAAAATDVGDAPRVAQTLVDVARLRLAPSSVAAHSAAILGSDLETRVLDLLADERRIDSPSPALLLAACVSFALVCVHFAYPIHRAAELAIRALSF